MRLSSHNVGYIFTLTYIIRKINDNYFLKIHDIQMPIWGKKTPHTGKSDARRPQ